MISVVLAAELPITDDINAIAARLVSPRSPLAWAPPVLRPRLGFDVQATDPLAPGRPHANPD
jgi:hypothetical protein